MGIFASSNRFVVKGKSQESPLTKKNSNSSSDYISSKIKSWRMKITISLKKKGQEKGLIDRPTRLCIKTGPIEIV